MVNGSAEIKSADAIAIIGYVEIGASPKNILSLLPLIEDDEDLVPPLRQASNEELEPLVEYIIEKGGVTAQLHRTQRYKQYSGGGNHRMYADDIAAEIQKFGANTFFSQTIRGGRGIKYRKLLKKWRIGVGSRPVCGMRRPR
jgi:hypothetical protein